MPSRSILDSSVEREMYAIWGKIFLAALAVQRLMEEYPGDGPPPNLFGLFDFPK